MAEFPQLPLWTDAYLADTTHLTTTEHGAYLLLLMAAWRSPGCRLPNDDKLLWRFAGQPKNWNRIKRKVLAFWLLHDGYYTQKRLLLEHERATNRAQQGRLGGLAKSLKYNNLTLKSAGVGQAFSTATTTIKESKKDLTSFSETTSEQAPGSLATAPFDSALTRPAIDPDRRTKLKTALHARRCLADLEARKAARQAFDDLDKPPKGAAN